MLEQIANFIFGLPGGRFTAAAILLAIFAALLYAAYKAAFRLLKQLAGKTETDFDDILFESMEDPARLLVVFGSIYLALAYTYPDISVGGAGLGQLFTVALMLVAAFALDRGLSTVIKWYKKEVAPKTESRLDDELIPIIEKVLRIFIYVVALMMVLGNLGIEITPLLAGLGIASLAVALALQDSLGNFFAGVNISVDRPLRKDDFIATDLGVEGMVQEIGWRSTKLLTLQNNHVIIPNTKLAQSVITNYYKPDETIIQSGTIGVAYNEDAEHVSSVIRAAILSASEKSQHIVKSYEPIVRLDSFGDFAINFKFFYKVKNYASRLPAADEVNRSILSQFRTHSIEIPFPTRVVYNHSVQEKSKAEGAKRKNLKRKSGK